MAHLQVQDQWYYTDYFVFHKNAAMSNPKIAEAWDSRKQYVFYSLVWFWCNAYSILVIRYKKTICAQCYGPYVQSIHDAELRRLQETVQSGGEAPIPLNVDQLYERRKFFSHCSTIIISY